MENLEFLARSLNGKDIYYDSLHSHTATHFDDTPQLKDLTIEAIGKSVLVGDLLLFDTEMGRIVGNSDLVENEKGDEIVYAKRKNREIYTSFNKTKRPQPCSTVAMGFKKHDKQSYELVSAWIGSVDSPPFPGDSNETDESLEYWMTHSLSWGTQEIQSGTETFICPW